MSSVKTSGPLSTQDVTSVFGGTGTVKLSEFYRGAGKVPNSVLNNTVPTSGTISMGNLYGAVNVTTITYQMIGGGGGGGRGFSDSYDGSSRAPSGTRSSISSGTSIAIVAVGGAGGVNGWGNIFGGAGQSSPYGVGGAAGNPVGGNAPSTSYGAGGGGAFGDYPSTYDSSGGGGEGGYQGASRSGTFVIPYGSTINIVVGSLGIGQPGGGQSGGAGAAGYVSLVKDGVTYVYASPGTYALTV
jgi:hypothetical protein